MRRLMLCSAASLVLALAAQAQEWELEQEVEWLERHPLGEPVDPGEVEFLDGAAQAGLPPPAPGKRYAVIDGTIVALDPESHELLQLIRRSAGVAEASEPALGAEAENADGEENRGRDDGEGDRGGDAGQDQAQGIPPGHLPPPGSCRVWHPDRPPGHQPPPTSCDVEVPPGAFLVRG